MAYTDDTIREIRQSNGVPENYLTISTTIGGLVFVDPTDTNVINAYQTGQLTGGESVPAGVWLRVLPPPPTPDIRTVVFPTPLPTPISIQTTPLVTTSTVLRAPTPLRRSINVPVFVEIIAKPPTIKNFTRVEVEVFPAQFPQQIKTTNYKFKVNVIPININISEPLLATANQFLDDIFETYVDEERELKTLLNYGEDKQSVVLAYRRGPTDTDGIDSIQLKLLQPVPEDITVDTPVFLGREVAKTTIDKVRVRFAPELDTTPYLRPKNLKVKADLDTGKSIRNVTLNKLSLQSGSVGRTDSLQNKTFEDQIFRQWYSYDFNSSELNIDFTNYENFVFYSSAALRLAAFKQKLRQIEKLENSRKQILATYTANTASAGLIYVQEKSQEYALEKENIIRAFDRYEQYLFFTPSGSTSPYSASFDYVDGGMEYNPVGYWPKSGSELWPVDSTTAIDWYTTQSQVAQRFDEFNENNLINTIPTYIREDSNNDAYITFVSMIGQLFDSIKLYVDQFPNIYSRNLNPNEKLSKDLVNDIAESMGFVVPSIDSIYNLTDNILGNTSQMPRRDLAAQIYKRILHNLPFFAKAKGTKTALQVFLNTFGITPQLLSIRETGTPTTSSYSVFDEYTTGLDFDDTSTKFIRVPVAASNRNPTTLQLNCTVAKRQDMTILTGDSRWALNVKPHPTITKLGRFEIASGSSDTTIVTSSYYEIFGDELLNVTLQTTNNTSSFYFTQADGEDVLFNQIITDSTKFPTLWSSTNYVFLGGAGARVIGRYDGTLDEIRLWNTALSDEVILNTAFDPGSNAGDTYNEAADNLLIQLSFNTISSASLAADTIQNESPYKNITAVPSLETMFCSNLNEQDFVRYTRTVKQLTPSVGSSIPQTNKIRVVDVPVFPNTSNGLRLYRDKSITPIEQKKLNRGRNKVILAMSPTDIVNQNIIRNLGLENINAVLGAPTTLYTTFEKSLSVLKNHYQQYHYVDVNTNKFIRILSDLSSVLNQVVDYFIPSKATVLKGIVIEPNILEQVKIPPVKNIRFYGKSARKTVNAAGSLTGSAPDYDATFNLEKVIPYTRTSASAGYVTYNVSVQETDFTEVLGNYNSINSGSLIDLHELTSLQSSYITNTGDISDELLEVRGLINEYKTTIQPTVPLAIGEFNNVSSSIELPTYVALANVVTVGSESLMDIVPSDLLAQSSYETYRIQHEETTYSGPQRDLRVSMELDNLNKIPFNAINNGSDGAEPYNRVYTRKLFNEEISTTRLGGVTSLYVPGVYDIPPVADFNDFGVYTYFNNTAGVYYFNEIKKQPVYPAILNATWNFQQQTFGNTATSWSYGARYEKHDVVYQDISQEDLRQYNMDTSLSVIGGNKRYYVFKTNPLYPSSSTTTAGYSGSVPSFTPPSLDRTNWDLLRFKPIQVRVPRRVVFDTYTIPDPALNNFRTTTISVDTIINIPDRYIDTFSIGTVQSSARITGTLTLQNIAVLFAIQTNVGGLRLRLYRTEEARAADLTRSFETRPTGAHGVLFDANLTGENVVEIANPIHTLVAGENPPGGEIFYTIDNLDTSTKLGVTIQLYYFAIEIEPRVPTGYLRKHYRFFRDNSTATKRRNYVGCLQTVETTIDGLPPIQVFIGEGTEIQVSPSSLNNEIVTGGGGTLNVT